MNAQSIDELEAGWPSAGPCAVTFGFADGGIADDLDPSQAPFSKRTCRYWPLVVCVSQLQRSLAPQLRRNFHAEVDWVTDTRTLRDAERDIRTRLQSVKSPKGLKQRFTAAKLVGMTIDEVKSA